MKESTTFNITKRNILILTIITQLSLLCLIKFNYIENSIFFIREIISFIYLFFLPGILLHGIIKVNKPGTCETILYSVGLSIFISMFTGFFANTFYPKIGITNPLSLNILIVTFILEIVVLSTIYYFYADEESGIILDLLDIFKKGNLFLYLLLLLAISGTYIQNYYQINTLLLCTIFIISMLPILVSCTKIFKQTHYPLVIFLISLSLLYHNSLISNHIWGWDVNKEFFLANEIIDNNFWDSTISSNINGMLSIVMIIPIFSKMSGMDAVWVFKIVYPFIFALVPVGLYKVYCNQLNDTNASFISVFFFTSVFTFFTEMLHLARQQIAELYIVLILLLITSKAIHQKSRSILLILFSFSVIVSHYALTYLFLLSLIILKLVTQMYAYNSNRTHDFKIRLPFVLMFFTFSMSWYLYVSHGSTFNSIVSIGNQISSNIYDEFFNPKFSQGISVVIMNTNTVLKTMSKYMHLICQFFITIGFFSAVHSRKSTKFNTEYLILCAVYYLFLIAGLTVPYFASSINTSRLYHISLILLSPLCVVGGTLVFHGIYSSIKIGRHKSLQEKSLQTLSIFFSIFFLFNVGFFYEISNDNYKTSISFNNTIDAPRFNQKEVDSAKWLINKQTHIPIHADVYRDLLLSGFSTEKHEILEKEDLELKDKSYLYFGTYNLLNNKVLITSKSGVNQLYEYIEFNSQLLNRNKIYDNKGVEIYI